VAVIVDFSSASMVTNLLFYFIIVFSFLVVIAFKCLFIWFFQSLCYLIHSLIVMLLCRMSNKLIRHIRFAFALDLVKPIYCEHSTRYFRFRRTIRLVQCFQTFFQLRHTYLEPVISRHITAFLAQIYG